MVTGLEILGNGDTAQTAEHPAKKQTGHDEGQAAANAIPCSADTVTCAVFSAAHNKAAANMCPHGAGSD